MSEKKLTPVEEQGIKRERMDRPLLDRMLGKKPRIQNNKRKASKQLLKDKVPVH